LVLWYMYYLCTPVANIIYQKIQTKVQIQVFTQRSRSRSRSRGIYFNDRDPVTDE
jgi:hypothetical protein